MIKKISLLVLLVCFVGCAPVISQEVKTSLKEKAIFIVEASVRKDYETVIQQGSLNFRTSATPEQMEAAIAQWPDVYGAYVGIDQCDIMMQDSFYLVSVSVNFEHYKQMYQLAFDNNQKMISIGFK